MRKPPAKPQDTALDHEKLIALDEQALKAEQEGRFEESLSALDEIISAFETKIGFIERMKGLLERAAYLCIVLKDYPRALHYQAKLVSLCETMYLRNKDVALPHPLLAFHYYQLGKL